MREAASALVEAITALHAEDEVGGVVVGLPTRLDGTASTQTARVRKMVDLLTSRLTDADCDAGRAPIQPRSGGAVGRARAGLAKTEGEA